MVTGIESACANLVTELPEADRTTAGYPGLESEECHRAWAEVVPILSERQATAVWLVCIGGYTYDEAGRILGMSWRIACNTANEGLRNISRHFHGPALQRSCPGCGWPPASIGHRTTCRPKPNHCEQGHEYTVENTRIRSNGRKVCRACAAAYRARRKNADNGP